MKRRREPDAPDAAAPPAFPSAEEGAGAARRGADGVEFPNGARVEAAPSEPGPDELERLRAREDELLRALAEQQNVSRRRRQEMEASVRYAQESLVRDLLPVLDDFERALAAITPAAPEPIRAGVALVRERLVRVLAQQGLEAIRPLGEPFDPELHDALAQRPKSGAAPGSILEVAEPGYRFRDRVLRHAKVIVAGPAPAEPAAPSEPAAPPEGSP